MSDYNSSLDVLVKNDDSLDILVHPGHKPLRVSTTASLYKAVDKEDKTVQLYFYSLAWVIPVLIQGNEEKITATLSLVESMVDISPDEERSGAWNMLWDDHAVCERLCVIIELLSNDLPLLNSYKNKLEQHLEKTYHYIEKLVASDRWLKNNHRLFHFLAAFFYYHHKGNIEKLNEFRDHISGFCNDLIDVETGFAREQCVSYCFFDINIVEKVISALSDLSVNIEFDVDKAHRNLLSHINAIAFPDHTLPASGDTPYGLTLTTFQKKYAIPNEAVHEHWHRLEALGYYRGESKDKRIQFLMLNHNGESGHGHFSPLHTDLWFADYGPVLVDSGGPFKYGDKKRYDWYRAPIGHNSLALENGNSKIKEISIDISQSRNNILGVVQYVDAKHCRFMKCDESGINIDEVIKSQDRWRVFYNFALGVTISHIGKNEFIINNYHSVGLKLSLSPSNISTQIETTQRCIGHSLETGAESLVVSGSPGVHFFTVSISRIT